MHPKTLFSPAQRSLRRTLLAAALGIASTAALAQASFPEKPLRLIVGYTAGGPTDIVARLVAEKLQAALGQTVTVENRAGAGSNIAAAAAAKAPADGHTLFMCTIANTTNMALHKAPGYDTLRDFAPVSLLMSAPSVLVVHPAVPARSVAELIVLAKKEPGKLGYASTGNGSSGHLAGEMFRQRTGVDMFHVPYKGASNAVTDLIGGQVPLGFQTAVSVLQNIQAGQLRALAVASPRRLAQLPNVPTLAEAGLPEFEVSSWNALCAPAATPPAVVQRLNQAAAAAMAQPDVREKLNAQGAEALSSTPEELRSYIQREITKWALVVKAGNIKLEGQ